MPVTATAVKLPSPSRLPLPVRQDSAAMDSVPWLVRVPFTVRVLPWGTVRVLPAGMVKVFPFSMVRFSSRV